MTGTVRSLRRRRYLRPHPTNVKIFIMIQTKPVSGQQQSKQGIPGGSVAAGVADVPNRIDVHSHPRTERAIGYPARIALLSAHHRRRRIEATCEQGAKVTDCGPSFKGGTW